MVDATAEDRSSPTRAADIERQVDDLLSSVAHELTTPLASAGAMAALLPELLGQDLADDAQTALASVRRNLQHAQMLVQRLRDLRAVESGALTVTPVEVDLVPLVREAVIDLRPVILQEHPVDLDLPQAPVHVTADPGRVRQILFNLLSNAARYSDAGLSIVITVQPEPAHGVVIVRNHGMGIAPDDAERIFDKYVRSDQAEDRSRGSGLGLYLSRRIAQALDGELYAAPAPEGEGSQFVLRLPTSAARVQ